MTKSGRNRVNGMRFKKELTSFKLSVNQYTQAMSFHLSKLSRYEPKKKTSPLCRAQLEHITNFPSSQLPDALCVTMKRSEHDLSRWGVCHTSLIHFNKVYFGTIISHCVSEESFIKESVDLISLFFY